MLFVKTFAFLLNVEMLRLPQPYGFDVGQSERGSVLKGLDLGVQGMRVGGQVRPVSSMETFYFIKLGSCMGR